MGVFLVRSHREQFLNAQFNIFSMAWKKNENIQIIAGGSTRSKGSAHNEEAEVNDVEK